MIISVILIPFIAGILVPVLPFRKRWQKEVFLETASMKSTDSTKLSRIRCSEL